MNFEEEITQDYTPVPAEKFCKDIKTNLFSTVKTDISSLVIVNRETNVTVFFENEKVYMFDGTQFKYFPMNIITGNMTFKTSGKNNSFVVNGVIVANISQDGVSIFKEYEEIYNDTLIIAKST